MKDKIILVTGGTGSFGKEFIKHAVKLEPKKLIVFSRDELKQWEMQQLSEYQHPNIRYFIGDIRDKERLERAFDGVDYVVHAAALKQVPAMEYNPTEAIQTNIKGTKNIINVALDCGVKKVLMLSTDKAVNPVNLYGATKLCAEKIMIAANNYGGMKKTHFSVVRYGNVVGSRGSVIPLFQEQAKTGVLTVTDERMTRFWITLEEAVKFVIQCLNMMQGAEIFVPKLRKQRIVDLAREICPVCEIKLTGIRPGEKLFETLISKDEGRKVKDYGHYYEIRQDRDNFEQEFEYTSQI